MVKQIIAALALSLCLISSQAEAFLASVKTLGMAGTGVAFPQDSLAAAYNPAGMAEVGDRLDVGLNWAHFVGDTRVHGNSFPGVNGRFNAFRTRNFFSPDIGINQVIGCDGKFSIGLSIFNREQSKTSYHKPFVLLGTSKLGLEYVSEQFSTTFAYRVTNCLDVGLSIDYHLQRLKVNGIENFANSQRSIFPGRVTNKGYNYSQGVGVTLGALWYINPCLAVGATYTPETHMGRFYRYKGFLAHRGKFNLPPLYSIGIAVRPWDCLTLAFDIQYQDWTRNKALHNPLIHNNTIEKLGSDHGPGFGWRARTFYRVGVNWDAWEDITLRAGYRHASTPIRPSQTVVNQLTLEPVLQDVLSVGGTYRMCRNEFSGYFIYGFEHTIHGKNSIPPPFGGGNADLRVQVYVMGVSWGYLF